MVVCKCRKATKLYCFVHKAPVCGECICFPEHQICVVRTYSEWVIDGEYDWPPKCCSCQAVLEEGTGPQTARLGCLHVMHTSCFVSHIQSFPPHTASAGYVCPACSTPIWPPKTIKDSGSRLHHMLKEAIMQTGLEKNLFGNYPVPMREARGPSALPAYKSGNPSSAGGRESNAISLSSTLEDGVKNIGGYTATSSMGPRLSESEIVEIDVPGSADNFIKSSSPVGPGATTRKGAVQVDRQNSDISYYADDEDYRKKYSRRGPYRHKLLRTLLPFWSSALPTLPVTAPPRKDALNANDAPVRHHRSSRIDPRKILLVVAILGCLATMGILYYTIAQRGLEDELPSVEQRHP